MNLVVTLPLSATSGPDADANKAGVKAALTGAHHWGANLDACFAHIDSVLVISQPVGALFDHLLDDHGRQVKKSTAGHETGIVCIGMNTLELLAVNGLTAVPVFTGSTRSGARRLLELSNPGRHYTLADMDARLRAGQLDTTNSLPIWSAEVVSDIEQQWGTAWKRFDQIIIVGGGSILLRTALARKFGLLAVFPEDGVLSTARGGYKLALMKRIPEAVSIDPGYGAIKMYSAAGSVIMPAAVSTNGSGLLGMDSLDSLIKKPRGASAAPNLKPLHIDSAHGSFWVGAGAHSYGRAVQSMDLDRLSGPEMLALLYGVLTQHAAASIDLAG